MIQTIVDDCLRDGQFDECDLTMRDLAVIVDTLERTVTTMFHHRIDYPGLRLQSRAAAPQDSGDSGGVRAGPRRRAPAPCDPGMEIDVAVERLGRPAAAPRARASSPRSLARSGRSRVRPGRDEVSVLLLRRPADARAQPAAIGGKDRPTDVLAFPAGGAEAASSATS